MILDIPTYHILFIKVKCLIAKIIQNNKKTFCKLTTLNKSCYNARWTSSMHFYASSSFCNVFQTLSSKTYIIRLYK